MAWYHEKYKVILRIILTDPIYKYPIDYILVLSIQEGFLEAISNQVSETRPAPEAVFCKGHVFLKQDETAEEHFGGPCPHQKWR